MADCDIRFESFKHKYRRWIEVQNHAMLTDSGIPYERTSSMSIADDWGNEMRWSRRVFKRDDGLQGVGASRATVAHIVEQVPSAALHANTAAGAAAAATTVPNVNPAPA